MDDYRNESIETQRLADACLNYLIGNPEELARFMDHTGIDGDTLRQSIGSRTLSLGMFDFFAQNESALLAMCANSGIGADDFMRTWGRLNPDN